MSSVTLGKTEIYTSASSRLCLPLVQAYAKGILFLRHDSPFVFSLRVFRSGSLIASSTSTDFRSIFDSLKLSFSERPHGLIFDIVVAGHISPLVHYIVFPLYLNVSYLKIGGVYLLRLPGRQKVDWVANLSVVIVSYTRRLRRLYGRKTVPTSHNMASLGVSYG